jgi:hypothetical protein
VFVLFDSSGKKSKEEQEKAAVEQEALEKITVVLEAGVHRVDCMSSRW